MSSSCNGQASTNAYGLIVLSSPALYNELIQAQPEQALVSLPAVVPGLHLDIRYATPNNLLRRPLYDRPAAWLRQPAATALAQVQQDLASYGLGLLVYDAYRPYSTTVTLYEAVQNESYVAPPWRGSRHNRGCAVDVSLVLLPTGRPVRMPTDFDELNPAARTTYEPVPASVRRYRALLLEAMHGRGFHNYEDEWWHFDFGRWSEFGLLDLPFSVL